MEKRFCAFIGFQENVKILQYTSDILQNWIVSDVKSKSTVRSSGVFYFRKVILASLLCNQLVGSQYCDRKIVESAISQYKVQLAIWLFMTLQSIAKYMWNLLGFTENPDLK